MRALPSTHAAGVPGTCFAAPEMPPPTPAAVGDEREPAPSYVPGWTKLHHEVAGSGAGVRTKFSEELELCLLQSLLDFSRVLGC